MVANPEDIRRYTVEFYQLASSVSKAGGNNAANPAGTQNFEQLLDLGASEHPDANDQHVVKIVDWLLTHLSKQRALCVLADVSKLTHLTKPISTVVTLCQMYQF